MGTLTIVIAIVALSVSMLTAGWTIYRDAIQKPKFRVSISLKTVVQAGREPDGPHIFVEALNMGPVSNRFGLVFCRESWWQRRIKDTGGAFIYPDYAHVATTRGSERIEVGDTATSVFPYDADCFLKEDFVQVGVSDGYGRMHWAPRAQLRKAREKYREKFSQVLPPQG